MINTIRLSGTKNTRYVTNGIIRSDKLDNLSEGDKEIMLSLGVDTVIDLRRIKNRISSIVDDERFDYHYCTLEVESWDEIAKTISDKNINDDDILVEQYLGYLLQYRVIYNILDIIKKANGNCVIMCHYGKDRTGVISALIGLIVNKGLEDIVEDYAVSSQNFKDIEDDNIFANLKSNEIIMRIFIEKFFLKYGNIDKYLELVGINLDEKQELIKKIVG